MAKKQKSFADKAAGSKNKEAVYVKYVKSVKSDKTGQWRFNEQIVQTSKGENLDVALKRLDELANLTDIDLSDSIVKESSVEETPVVENENVATDEVDAAPETTDEPTAAVVEEEKV
ncbi:MAG: DUF4295 family protein [Candidatus Marinimicrobia bacterium]|jgi:hypothetical protein|nr:DUF4295 family protein [Candidatus Neomarinimicrobiota bacterium]MBT3502017.1 DUF4295 family protein [Candidatus Neomarinimicrobiota bacterium]MBT3838485.1 DUF4295 family protein [Candidatus Neomarinimicrobiota bacterium]MBT3999514.1 DUF4295 family protein [Candidatus Neomarinimicrobiota bacterium]MBT4281786.1 DUF4295 family protein [Candidatus Neomarinimicrobiota bacterium]